MNGKTPGTGRGKHIVLNVLLVVCVAVILFCGVKIVQSLIEYRKAAEKNKELNDIGSLIGSITTTTAGPTVTTITPETTTTEPMQGTDGPETTTTTEAITTEPTPVPREEYRAIYEQLSAMKEQYPDLFGWIYIKFDDTHIINLPVMQSDDNNYYISHAYDGTESKAGAIFVDYRNTDRRIDLNQNMIMYGHNMNNRTMFALLSTQYKKREMFDTVPIIFYSLEGQYTFNVFSIYNAEADSGYETIGFSKENLKAFCEERQMLSFFSKKLTFTGEETITTLVTCTNYASDKRIIVHGVLDGYDPFFD